MQALVAVVLAAIIGVALGGPDAVVQIHDRLVEDLAAAERLEVRVTRPARPGLGGVGRVEIVVDGVDARDLPLAPLVPVPHPRAVKGRIDRVDLHATGVRLETLRASEVSYTASEVSYDLVAALRDGQVRTTRLGRQELTVRLRDGDLDEYLAGALPGMTDAHATFESGRLVVRAKVPVLVAAFNVRLSGEVAIRDGHEIVLNQVELDTGRIELSDDLRQSILGKLDPLVDLAEVLTFPAPLLWTGVEVGDGEALFHGVLAAPETPTVQPTFRPRERYLR